MGSANFVGVTKFSPPPEIDLISNQAIGLSAIKNQGGEKLKTPTNFDFSRRGAIALSQGSGLSWSSLDSGFGFHRFECKDLDAIGRT